MHKIYPNAMYFPYPIWSQRSANLEKELISWLRDNIVTERGWTFYSDRIDYNIRRCLWIADVIDMVHVRLRFPLPMAYKL